MKSIEMKTMGMKGLTMVERNYEGNDKDFCSNTNIAKFEKLHILPKMWPLINWKH
jgi:hypothetical protein